MNEKILQAIHTPADYSESFDNFVGEICQNLSSVFRVTLKQDTDMNYSSAQKIILWLDKEYTPVNIGDEKVQYKLIVFVSSKGQFFTFLCEYCKNVTSKEFKKLKLLHPGRYWFKFKSDEIPPYIQSYMERIEVEMTLLNYTLLSGSILSEKVEGVVTDLDGILATLFEALFSELEI